MARPTDTLRVSFPSRVISLAAAKADLMAFGDVEHVEILDTGDALVTYFDVRCAEHAAEALGDRCERQPVRGVRTVWLAGDITLDRTTADGLADISADPTINGGFTLKFFDTRVAKQASAAGHTSQAVQHSTPVNPQPLPACIEGPPGLAAPMPDRSLSALLLNGIPNALCSKLCVQAMLEQAGLATDVESFKFRQGQHCGEVSVSLRGLAAVERCRRHFEGMHWDPVMPVSVTEASSKTWAYLDRVEPARVEVHSRMCRNGKNGRLQRPARHVAKIEEPETEESTEAGLSEEDEAQDLNLWAF